MREHALVRIFYRLLSLRCSVMLGRVVTCNNFHPPLSSSSGINSQHSHMSKMDCSYEVHYVHTLLISHQATLPAADEDVWLLT
jgi:hypothetical protein